MFTRALLILAATIMSTQFGYAADAHKGLSKNLHRIRPATSKRTRQEHEGRPRGVWPWRVFSIARPPEFGVHLRNGLGGRD